MRRLVLAALLLFPAPVAAQTFDQVAAGRYQAILGDCEGCHTAPGGKPFAGGVPIRTPFGTLVAPNITPDRDTGIGGWRAADFRRAMKRGIAPGGRRLYPAMPYPAYARMRDGDIAALWAYLGTLTPVHDKVKVNRLSFPFNIRMLMAGWNWLYPAPATFTDVPGKSAQWNRGAYLVTGAGHCGTCHTPKTLLGADRGDAALGGAALQGWVVPAITDARTRGLGDWSVADIVRYLGTGWNGHAAASGPMAEVVEHSTSRMRDADLEAIAVYLKDLPAAPPRFATAPLSPSDARMKAGAMLYRDNCAACHGADGKGERLLFPPLTGNPAIVQARADSLVRVVLMGAQAAATAHTPTAPAMPSFAFKLKDAQVADLLTYVRNSWGNRAPPVTESLVRSARASAPD